MCNYFKVSHCFGTSYDCSTFFHLCSAKKVVVSNGIHKREGLLKHKLISMIKRCLHLQEMHNYLWYDTVKGLHNAFFFCVNSFTLLMKCLCMVVCNYHASFCFIISISEQSRYKKSNLNNEIMLPPSFYIILLNTTAFYKNYFF